MSKHFDFKAIDLSSIRLVSFVNQVQIKFNLLLTIVDPMKVDVQQGAGRNT